MLINTSLIHLNLIASSSNCLFYTTFSFLSLFHAWKHVGCHLFKSTWKLGLCSFLWFRESLEPRDSRYHLRFAESGSTMWERQELICDYFAGLVYSCFIHSWGNWGLQRKGGLRRQLRNSTLKQISNFCIIDASAKLITNRTQNRDLRIITEYKLAMKNYLCIFF